MLTDAHRRLAWLEGTWVGTERRAPSPFSPSGSTADGRIENRLGVDGFAVITDYEQQREGAVTLRGHGIITHDAVAGGYVLHWTDSLGYGVDVLRGGFAARVLRLTGDAASGHGLLRHTYDLSSRDRIGVRIDTSLDGVTWLATMECVFRRV